MRSRWDRLALGPGGALITRAHPAYDEARSIWNGQVDATPAAVARCATAADVQACIRHAVDHGIELAVRGGGHNVAGHATVPGGLVIDLTPMRRVAMDTATGVAVGGGATLGDLDRGTIPNGAVVPAGIVTDTGVGGLTLGGGMGWNTRRFGLTCDSLRRVELVTAAGEILVVDGDTDPELMWALRGGGGNFGVVTRFDFATHPHPGNVAAGFVIHPVDEAADVLVEIDARYGGAQREVTLITFLRHALPLPWIPPEVVGSPVAMIGAVAALPPEEGLAALAPLRHNVSPGCDGIAVRPFLAHQAVLDIANPWGRRYHWKSEYVGGMTPELARLLAGQVGEMSSPASLIAIFQQGGAVADGAPRSCTPYRDAGYVVNYAAQWSDPVEDREHMVWAGAALRQVEPFGLGGGYVNFGEGRPVRGATGPTARERRLVAVKRRLDPGNVFRNNHNIEP